jgi:outer membrane protein OmpA-like peptidoglycan-associated protein/opacity protein-like surface antigen
MQSRVLKTVSRVLALAALTAVSVSLAAQTAPKPAMTYADAPSRWDIFAGYSYLNPHDTVQVVQRDGTIVPYWFRHDTQGAIASGTYFFNKYVGAQVEVASHGQWVNDYPSNNNALFTAGAGLEFRDPMPRFTPFAHGLVNAERGSGPFHEPSKWGAGLTAGGGVDVEVSRHFAIRLVQADYEYFHINHGPGGLNSSGTFIFGGRANVNALRLSAGIVIHAGSILPPPQLTVACAVNPTSVFPGDPVTATATVGSQEPKSNVVVAISGDGVSGNGATATVDTADLQPGQHTVTCNAKEGKTGHEGAKPWQLAQATTASFTVKEFEPPTVSCSVNPTTIKPGDSASITATGMSPQNRPLTYTYSASAGTVNGSGNSATFASTGAPTGPVSITCNVSDDKGHNASANTTVTIEAPPPPPQPHAQALCSITFSKDKARPARVDNEAKACLDEVALDLQRQSDAKAVVVGETNAAEKAKFEKEQKMASRRKHHKEMANLAAQRAVNTKDYLTTEKGIDPSRISVATGSGDDQKVEDYLVPSGADFNTDVQGTTPVDESMVKPEKRKPLAERHHHHAAKKKAAK